MKKKLLVLMLLLIAVIFLFTKYWKHEFDEVFDCIQFEIGDEIYEPIDVRIRGSINRSLLRSEYISYTIWIGDEQYPKENELLVPFLNSRVLITNDHVSFDPVNTIQTSIRKRQNSNYLVIAYDYWEDEVRPDFKYHKYSIFGGMFYDDDMSEIIITVSNPDEQGLSWTNKTGNKIIVSESNIEDARKTIKEIGNFDIE